MPVCPLFLQGPLEAFRFRVLSRAVRPGQQVIGAQGRACGFEVAGTSEVRRFVGHHPCQVCRDTDSARASVIAGFARGAVLRVP